METEAILTYPHWLTITHFINFLFITLLIRSGIQILADHPRLYMNEHCTPSSNWIKFTKKKVPKDKYYTSMDDAVDVSPWIALPGGFHNLGHGRHWHFFCVLFWVLNGIVYITLLFATEQWRRLLPVSWEIFPQAWHSLLRHLSFQYVQHADVYNPIEQLTYAAVVFILAPLTILTGAAMSPSLAGRFPWYPKLFGGRQRARSFHFILLIAFLVFLTIHLIYVCLTGFGANMAKIVLGIHDGGHQTLAIVLGITGIVVVILANVFATILSQKKPRFIQVYVGSVTNFVNRYVFSRLRSKQRFTEDQISPYFWVNGYPPQDPQWIAYSKEEYKSYKLHVSGLVEVPLELSFQDLQNLPKSTQITQHTCIQGWTGIAGWGGVSLKKIIELCRPLPTAKYVVFRSYQRDENGYEYYSTLKLDECFHPQTILAYEMNGEFLSIGHGAPLRLRMESKLGFKMTKWLKSVEFVEDYKTVGLGYGGYREDWQFFSTGAQI